MIEFIIPGKPQENLVALAEKRPTFYAGTLAKLHLRRANTGLDSRSIEVFAQLKLGLPCLMDASAGVSRAIERYSKVLSRWLWVFRG
jgi:hypothetical protein